MEFKGLLVVIPHNGILIPREIAVESLSPELPWLMRNVDWYTGQLYDFRDILGNSQIEFPYCSLVLEANRAPGNLDESVPMKDVFGEPVYKSGYEPDAALRRRLSRKYLQPFHKEIGAEIERGKTFMLDAHSTISSRGVEDNQIELMNYQTVGPDRKKVRFCPDIYLETYAFELAARLPGIKITINESRYSHVYGHVCGKHSLNSMRRERKRVPAILQETNQKLYITDGGTPNIEAIERLRRAFAAALLKMMERVSGLSGNQGQ